MKALVIGGAGGIGLHLCRTLLEADARVDILDNFNSSLHDSELIGLLDDERVRLIRADRFVSD